MKHKTLSTLLATVALAVAMPLVAHAAGAASSAQAKVAQAKKATKSGKSTPLASAPATVVHENCSWDHPGRNPFVGDITRAVDRYTDIPENVRAKLKERMVKQAYDEMVTIKRDGIEGKSTYAPAIRDMHFGVNHVCHSVSRAKWSEQHAERGLVYCEEGQCLLVPTVCRNVSRIDRVQKDRSDNHGGADAVNQPGESFAELAKPQDGPLMFDAPGAGFGAVPGEAGGTPALLLPVNEGVPPGGGFPPIIGTPGHTFVPPLPPPPPVVPPVVPPIPVPEPGTWALMVAGLLGMGAVSRRRRSA